MVITVYAVKTSLQFLNQKLSQKPVTGLLKFQHDQKLHLHYYHLQLEYYPLYVYFVIKEGKKNEVHGKNLEKIEKHETKIAIRNKAKMLIDELMILKIGNYNFGEGPNFAAKGVIITMNVKETIYIKKINLVISKILHWKSLLAMQETK